LIDVQSKNVGVLVNVIVLSECIKVSKNRGFFRFKGALMGHRVKSIQIDSTFKFKLNHTYLAYLKINAICNQTIQGTLIRCKEFENEEW